MPPTEPLAYLNGAILPQSEARLPLHDAGFVMGATVTDLVRTFRHRPFRLADHLARFRRGCDAALIPQSLTDRDLTAGANYLLAHNARLIGPHDDLALVFLATPGPIGYYLGEPGGPGDGPPTLGIHTFPLPFARYATLFTQGAALVCPPTRAVPATVVPPTIKQRSRLHWWLADRQARQLRPGASALLLDDADRITETAAANFLAVLDGVVCSPPRTSVLPGVSLLVVEELCHDLGIPFAERPLTLADCRQASEALLTCTSFCVCGVSWLEDRALPWPGPVLRRLLDAWGERVGIDLVGQILSTR